MAQRRQIQSVEEDAIDLGAVWPVLWRHKLVILAACVVCGGTAAVLGLLATPIYRAEAVVTEARDRGMGGGNSLVSQLGGLASLAGVNLTPEGAGSQEAQAVLVSRHLAEEFVKRHDLMHLLLPKVPHPTLWRATKSFQESVVAVRQDQRKGTTIVDIEWTDAATAARWANEFVALANELVRTRALNEAIRNIAYINEQLAKTTDVELRKVMYTIIETETKNLMLANGRLEYAFEVVDPAVSPEVRARPQRTLMVLVGLVIGVFLGIVAALVLERLGSRRGGSVRPAT